MFYTSKSAEEGVLDAPKGKDGSGSRSFESRNGWKEVPHICTHISISAPNVCCFIFLMKSKKTKKKIPCDLKLMTQSTQNVLCASGGLLELLKILKDLLLHFTATVKSWWIDWGCLGPGCHPAGHLSVDYPLSQSHWHC